MSSEPETSALSRGSYFVNVQVWPTSAKLDASGWLRNFSDSDKPYALSILRNFLYFSKPITESMFASGFANLGAHVFTDKTNAAACKTEWLAFLSNVLVVRVTGETPSDADSGFIFARMARDIVGIPESQIVPPQDAIEILGARRESVVVFVDDFVGTGNQFLSMWHRAFTRNGIPLGSFSSLRLHSAKRRIFYVPLICTSDGASVITVNCPDVVLAPVHLLSPRYSVLQEDSIFWKGDPTWPKPYDALRAISLSVGLSESDGDLKDWRGFLKLGTALAFEHGSPDSNLKLLSWDKGGWTPLLKK